MAVMGSWGILFWWGFMVFWAFIFRSFLIFFVCIFCSVQDLVEQKVSDFLIFAGCFVIFICDFYCDSCFLYFISGGLLFFIYFITKLVVKSRMGWGDVFFAFFSGLCLRPFFAVLSIIISVLLAVIFMFSLSFYKGWRNRIAFVPFMSVGLIICHFLMF